MNCAGRRVADLTGWLLDLYEDERGGAALWLIGDDGGRHRLRQDFPVTFYAAGERAQLKALWVWLRRHPLKPRLAKDQRRDLFQPEPLTVLKIELQHAARQPQLFHEIMQRFPDLDYYDADLSISLRHAALYGTFPLARCYVRADESGFIQKLRVLDLPWDLDPSKAPLRALALRPDCDPAHANPRALIASHGRHEYHFSLEDERPLLVNLRALLTRLDPDLLLTANGDTWLLPRLLDLAQKHNLPLPLNRDPGRGVTHKKEGSYFSYGQIIYRGQQILLYGRCHIDCRNAMMWQDYDLEGALETARITALPIQTAARVSPGTGISSMQITTALRNDILVPWRKQQAEQPKTAADLIRFDQGGLVYQPITGLHFDVGMIDFISMYPSIMVRSNISPETPFPDQLGSSDYPPGLVPLTLGPLLEKRVALKQRALNLPAWDPRRRMDKARSAAHKWLLVTCFGYLGYKNARFGRIEAHEAVTTWGREALLRAKEAAEELGFEVLHMYVDGLWVRKDGCRQPQDFQPLLEEVAARASLPVVLDGVYRWVAFLPSRVDERLPVPNRYFGVFQDGSVKARGIDLRARRVPLESLLVGKKLSKELAGYRVPSPGARAALQLLAAGKPTRPGQRIRLLFTRGEPGVHAWNLPSAPDPATLDYGYYEDLMLRAAAALLQPFGVAEEDMRVHVRADLGEQLALPMHAWNRQRPAAECAPDLFKIDSVCALADGL